MISITPIAQEKLTAYLAENKVEPKVRAYLPSGGCCGGGGQISLTLDRPNADDITTKAGDLELFMEPSLYEQVGKVTIDFKDDGQDAGFVVESEKQLPADDDGCGGCSCCG